MYMDIAHERTISEGKEQEVTGDYPFSRLIPHYLGGDTRSYPLERDNPENP